MRSEKSCLISLRNKVKEYEEKVNKIIHATVLNDQGVADLDSKKKSIIQSMVKTNASLFVPSTDKQNPIMQSLGMTPEYKKKKFNKSSLINQYSSIISKRCKKDKNVLIWQFTS